MLVKKSIDRLKATRIFQDVKVTPIASPGNPANVQLARTYDSYLKTLKDSFRGVTNDREADKLIGQARQTRNYLAVLVKQSSR